MQPESIVIQLVIQRVDFLTFSRQIVPLRKYLLD